MYTEEQNENILHKLEESAKIISFRPITQDDIDIETNKLTKKGMPEMSRRDIEVTATKKIVIQFIKET